MLVFFNAICLTSKAFCFSKKKKISSTNIGTPLKSARAAEAKYRHWKDGKRFVIRHIGMSKMWSTWKRNGGTSWLVALTTDCSCQGGGGGSYPLPGLSKLPQLTMPNAVKPLLERLRIQWKSFDIPYPLHHFPACYLPGSNKTYIPVI